MQLLLCPLEEQKHTIWFGKPLKGTPLFTLGLADSIRELVTCCAYMQIHVW